MGSQIVDLLLLQQLSQIKGQKDLCKRVDAWWLQDLQLLRHQTSELVDDSRGFKASWDEWVGQKKIGALTTELLMVTAGPYASNDDDDVHQHLLESYPKWEDLQWHFVEHLPH